MSELPQFNPARDTDLMAVLRQGLDPDPPRCWSCGHPFGAGCECTCCYDDHSEEPGPHEL